MLRDDRQVALDDVIVALETAADAYADAFELLQPSEPELASRFDMMARRRSAAAARLSEHLQAMGDLPSEPDQDLSTLDTVVRHLRAQFVTAEWDELISEAVAHEEEIAAKAELAVETGPPDAVVAALNDVAEEARQTIAALRRERSEHE